MAYQLLALDMFQAPNNYAPTPGGTFNLTEPNAQTLWFQLQVSDSLGVRRFIPPNGTSLTLEFQRANKFVGTNRAPQESAQTVLKTATPNTDDRSLFSVALTTQDVTQIRSGTLKVNITTAGVTTSFVDNFAVRKKLTDPGC